MVGSMAAVMTTPSTIVMAKAQVRSRGYDLRRRYCGRQPVTDKYRAFSSGGEQMAVDTILVGEVHVCLHELHHNSAAKQKKLHNYTVHSETQRLQITNLFQLSSQRKENLK
jgi:hypothetical protein